MKKWIILVAVIGVCLLLLPLMAEAEIVESGTCGENIEWTLDSDGLLTLSGTGAMYDYYSSQPCIPHLSRTKVKQVIIQEGITSIGNYGLYCCSSATSISIPKSIKSIGYYAFWGWSKLTEIQIPYGVETIGSKAFYGCSKITSICLPDSITEVEIDAFTGCKSIISFTYPKGYFQKYRNRFFDFSNNKGTCGENCVWELKDNTLTITGTGTIQRNAWNAIDSEEDIKLSIGEGITGICDSFLSTSINSFFHNHLIEVALPESLTHIGENAFSGCKKLKTINLPSKLQTIKKGLFQSCVALTSITIPDSVISIGEYAFYGCNGLTSVVIPDSVKSIGEKAFYGCNGLTSVVIPDSVKSIGENTFCGCNGLTSVVIPDSVKSIGNFTFYNCTGLASITISDSVISIGDYAFYGCTGLTSVVIPDSIISIGNSAFYRCTGLTNVVIPDSITSIGNNAFDNNITIISSWNSCAREWALKNKCSWEHYEHTLKTHFEVAATCTEDGTEAYWECSECHKLFSDEKGTTEIEAPMKIPAFEHDWDKPVYEWSEDNTKVTATRVCKNNEEHVETETVNSTFEIKKPASTKQNKEILYTSGVFVNKNFEIQTKTVELGSDVTLQIFAHVKVTVPGSFYQAEGSSTPMYRDKFSSIAMSYKTINVSTYQDLRKTLKSAFGSISEFTLNGISMIGVVDNHNTYKDTGVGFIVGNQAVMIMFVVKDDIAGDISAEIMNSITVTNIPAWQVIIPESKSTMKIPGTFVYEGEKNELHEYSDSASGMNLSHIIIDDPDTSYDTIKYVIGQLAGYTVEKTNKSGYRIIAAESSTSSMNYYYAGYMSNTNKAVIIMIGYLANNQIAICNEIIDTISIKGADEQRTVLELPSSLKIIEKESFAGVDCQAIIIPDGCKTIEEYAFARCTNLIYIRIPASVKSYPANAFEGCNKNLVIDWVGH